MGKIGASSIEVFKSEGSIESIDFSGEGGKSESAALTAASTAADYDSISALAGDMCQCSSIPGGSGRTPMSRGVGGWTPGPRLID